MFEQIGKTMIEVSLLSVAAILLVMILRAVFGAKLKTRLLGVLWMVVLLRLVLPVTFDSPVHLGDVFSFNASPIERMAVQDSEVASPHTTFNGNDSAAFDMDLADKPNTETTNVSVDNAVQKPIEVNPWHVMLAVWLAGTFRFLIVNVYRMFAFKRKVYFGKTLDTPVIHRLIISNKTKLGLSKNIRVMECRYISVPVVMGFKQPMILLPEGLVGTIDECRLDKIVLHEMCHIKRKDLLKSFLWLAARAIHWFNPLIWFAYKAYLDDVERACDETAMRYLSRDGIYEYSEALVEVVKCAKLNCNAPVLVSFCKDKSKLRKRVINMIKPQRKSKSVSIIAVFLMLTIVLGCFTTACTSVEPQELSAEATSKAVTQPDETLDEAAPPDEQTNQVPKADITYSRDDALKAASQYTVNGNKTLTYDGSESHKGEVLFVYLADDERTEYRIRSTDLSLRSIHTDNHTMDTPVEITDQQAMDCLKKYVNRFWPEMNVVITELECTDYSFHVNGVLINPDDQSKQNLWATIGAKGELLYICRLDKIDIEQSITEGTAVSLEKARELALACLSEQVHITKSENLKTVNQKFDNSLIYPQYVFEFEYRSDHPSFSEFDYNARITVDPTPSTHNPSGWLINPIVDNLDIIPIQKAEKLAREYTLSTYKYLKAKDLHLFSKQISLHSGKIYYWIDFERPNECITVFVSAETGECSLY